jgi:hypothetical protein
MFHVWRDASYTSGPLKKILVVAVRKDQSRRRTWEDGFAAELSRRGVDATPSYRVITDTLPDMRLINTIARDRSFDGLVLIGKVSRKTTQSVTAGIDLNSPNLASHPWGGWDYGYYDHEYYPGYPVEHEIVKDEIEVWATQGGGRMIWTGVGELRDRDREKDASGDIIALIVPELLEQHIFAGGS